MFFALIIVSIINYNISINCARIEEVKELYAAVQTQ